MPSESETIDKKPMKQKKHLLVLLLMTALCALQSGAAYADNFFQRVDTKSVSVYSLFKDHKGLLWAGTSKGLMSYPQLLSSTPTAYKRPHDLSIIITQISEDNLGRLWLRTQANHALIYNPKDNSCITDVEHYLQDRGLRLWYEFQTETDRQGRMWFYKDNRLTVYDCKTGARAAYAFAAAQGRIVDVVRQRNTMFVVTTRGLFDARLKGPRLVCRQMAMLPEKAGYAPTLLTEDGRGNVWIKVNEKLMRRNIATGRWTTCGQVPSDIKGIVRDNDGNVVVGTSNDGLFVFDTYGNLCRRVMQKAPLVDGLTCNHIQSLYADEATHTIFIGYHKSNFSLMRLDARRSRLLHIQNERNHYVPDDVISMALTKRHTIWVGTEDNGAYEIDAQGRQLRNLFEGTTATAVMEDSSGKLWAGLYFKGLYCEDGRCFFRGLSPYNIIEVAPTRFFINLNGSGLFVLNPKTGETRRIETENVWIMDIRRSGGKIFGATPLFLYIIDVRTLHVDKLPAARFCTDFGKGIKTMMTDHRGWVWMVNYMQDSPVTIYDYRHARVTGVSELARYTVRALSEDRDGNVWCATDDGLVRVKVSDGKAEKPRFSIVNFGNPQGVLCNERAAMTADDGKLMFGTTTGLMMIDPKAFATHPQTAIPQAMPLAIATLRINDIAISPGDTIDGRVIMEGDISTLKTLRLNAKENNLTIELRERSISDGGNKVWRYRLEGLNNYFMRMNGQTVTLSNLPSGSYRLVLAQEVNGRVTDRQYEVLDISIAPPFYASVWAILIYILMTAAAAYMVYRLIYNRQQYRLRTQKMRMEAEQEERLNEVKLDFFTNVSHEFRTPLTMILTPIDQLLKEPEVKGRMRETLTIVNESARHLFGLINQLLDFRRLNTTKPELHAQLGDLQEFVVKVCRIYDLQAQLHHICFDYDHDDLHRLVAFDAMKMEKIVNNLLSNAFKYTPDGGTISVTVTQEGNEMHLRVADTGQGISDKDKPRVFDRYYRGANHLNDSHSSGVGLQLVKEYVALHKGTVTIGDNVPCGTVFEVALPMEEAALHDTAVTETVMEGTDAHEHSLLVVEDNTDMLRYLSRELARDYRVLRATNGNAALEILKRGTPDVIVSDVMMPGMDGLTICKTVKGDINLSHIPVILLTAKALAEDELRGLQMGANDYVVKPFSLDVLRERIRLQIERREAVHEQIGRHVEIEPSEVTVTTLDEQFIKNAIACVEKNMDNADFTVDDMSNELSMHRTNLYKKMQYITGKTPLQFVRLLRLKRAHQLMSQGGVMVSQVAYQVGFNNPKLFARYFKEEYGMYPSEFIKKV